MTTTYIFPDRRADKRLGRIAAHDERSRSFARQATGQPLRTVLHKFEAPILDQGDLGGCTGYTGVDIMNTARYAPARKRARTSTRYLRDVDAKALYSRATQIDDFAGQWPPEDTGSSGLAVAKALKEQGYINAYEWVFGWQSFQRNLMDTPIMCGTWWYEGMFDPEGELAVVHPTGQQVGGHEYMCIGANYRLKYLTFVNHWGRNWGDRGRFRMTFADFAELLADDGDAVVPVM